MIDEMEEKMKRFGKKARESMLKRIQEGIERSYFSDNEYGRGLFGSGVPPEPQSLQYKPPTASGILGGCIPAGSVVYKKNDEYATLGNNVHITFDDEIPDEEDYRNAIRRKKNEEVVYGRVQKFFKRKS